MVVKRKVSTTKTTRKKTEKRAKHSPSHSQKTHSERANVSSQKRLYRSKNDKMVAGVCGGLGEYFDIDPVWLRLAFVLLALQGVGVLLYIIFWIIVPENPHQNISAKTKAEDVVSSMKANRSQTKRPTLHERNTQRNVFLGLAIIIIGTVLLLRNMVPWIRMDYIWPALIVLFGIYLILGHKEK